MIQPKTSYACNGDVNIAYQVIGDGPRDLLFIPAFVSHLDLYWTAPETTAFFRRLASFSRLILFDKRGTGLSDPASGVATLEERMEDVRAVLDACGSQQAALFGLSEGGPMSLLFAATYPERTTALITFGSFARLLPAPHYFWERREGASYPEDLREEFERFGRTIDCSPTRSKIIGAKARRSRCSCPVSPVMRMRRGCSACSSARRQARRWSARCINSTPRSTSPRSCP